MNRAFSIPGTVPKPDVEWRELDLSESESVLIDQHQHQLPTTLLVQVRSVRFGPRAMVACFHGKDGWAYDRSAGWFSTRSISEEQRMYVNYVARLKAVNGMGADSVYGEADFFRWIYHASVAPSNSGLFTLMNQTAPKGGAMCDDLLLLDSSDANSWLLVVVVPEKDDFTVYRKLMRLRD